MSSVNTELYELSAHQTAYQRLSDRWDQHELSHVLSLPDRPRFIAHSSSEPLLLPSSSELHEKVNVKPQNNGKPTHTILTKVLSLGLCVAVIVLVANSSLLIWSALQSGGLLGNTTLYEGSCTTSKRISTATALTINILSTVLLAISNNAAQFLSAPTREEIDAAHQTASWLDIGQMSLRNLRRIAKRRFILWSLLLLSSFPLHMFWNAVVLERISTNSYFALLVTDDFLNPISPWNRSLEMYSANGQGLRHLWDWNSPHAPDPVAFMHDNWDSLTRLDNEACLQAYATDYWQSKWRNVLVVTDANVTENWFYSYGIDVDQVFDGYLERDGRDWPCGSNILDESPCDKAALLSQASSWTIGNISYCPDTFLDPVFNSSGMCYPDVTKQQTIDAPVKYCLAEPTAEHCSIEVSTSLLLIVVICNLVKVLCLLGTLMLPRFQPIAIVGDAISSFMSQPDTTTASCGPVSHQQAKEYMSARRKKIATPITQPWNGKRTMWWRGISTGDWVFSTLLFVGVWTTAVYLLINNFLTSFLSRKTYMSTGFGLNNNALDTELALHSNLIKCVLIGNSPQIAISALYLFYNNIFTCMLRNAETTTYGTYAGGKHLRTSFPQHEQRAAHFLQIPWRYAIPLMSAYALLHFFISQALFIVINDPYDAAGNLFADLSITQLMWSPEALMVSLMWLTVLLVVLYGFGLRRLDTRGMPLLGSCSVAISAACHSPLTSHKDAGMKVQYGEIGSVGMGRVRAGFGTNVRLPLQSGIVYS